MCHNIERRRSAGQSMDLAVTEAVLCLNEAGSTWVVPLYTAPRCSSGSLVLKPWSLEAWRGNRGSWA